MKKSDVVVLTTIFQQNHLYVDAYFTSLVQQTFQGFDVLLVNDGFADLAAVRRAYPSLNICEFTGVGNVAKNRELLVNRAIDLGYSKAIFADFDDYFSINRIDISVALLDMYDIVVNDLAMVVDNVIVQEKYLASTLQDHREIVLNDVLESNFMGMSNTGIKLSCLKSVNFHEALKAVDWYFFSKMLIDGARAVFTNQCVTYYRQHGNNVANIGQVTRQQLLNELSVKTMHYELLVSSSRIYESLLVGVKDFNQCINTSAFTDYYERIENHKRLPFWWNIFNLNDYLANKK